MKILEKRLEGEYGRSYIEKHSDEDRKYHINSMGKAAQENAWGEIVAVDENGKEYPVMCGHGGSMWLCRKCKDEILLEQAKQTAPTK